MNPIVAETVKGRERFYLKSTATNPSTPKLYRRDSKLDDIEHMNDSLEYQWKDLVKSDQKMGYLKQLSLPVLQYVTTLFLPVGYPKSVHSVYTQVHIWQFVETMIGSAVSVLCSEAMLTSIGVGSHEAVAGGAVAIQWVLKDGIGEVGKLFFIQRYANTFDSHPKTWKLVGEVSSLIGSTLQLLTVILPPSWFLLLASIGYAARGIHYSIWGATHMTFTRNFALAGNVGDLVAKDDSQMSVAHLIGMLLGVSAISLSSEPLFLFGLFAILCPIHFYSTLALVRAAEFEVLNEGKLILIAEHWVKHQSIPTIHGLKPKETWFGEYIHPSVDATPIQMGVTIKQAFASLSELESCLSVFDNENYLLHYRNGIVYIVYRTDASVEDIICSILHAVKFYREFKNHPSSILMSTTLAWIRTQRTHYIASMTKQGWLVDAAFWGDCGNRVQWGYQMKKQV